MACCVLWLGAVGGEDGGVQALVAEQLAAAVVLLDQAIAQNVELVAGAKL